MPINFFPPSNGGGGGGSGTVTSVNVASGTGISATGGPITSAGSITVTNTAPDQVVTLTQGGTTTVSGTYPNFTVSSADQFNGTVTSVAALTIGTAGTDLSSTVATGSTTPVITLNIPTASATNRGVLSSANWSTFNGKQDALVSGTNIKTINGSSILGSGDLTVSGTVTGFWAATVDKLTGTQASSVTGLANVTQLVEAMVANGVYLVDCFVTFQSAATTTGLNLGFTSPTGSICQLEVVVPIVSTAAASALRVTFPNTTSTNTGNVLGTGVTAINSNHTARISGIVTCGATPGNFQIQFASEVSASAVTLQIGSSLVMQRIA